MRLETVLFDKVSSYGRMTKVLAHSVAENSPTTPLTIHRVRTDDIELVSQACPYVFDKTVYLDNARKTKHHFQIVQAAANGDELCLLDCDTFVLKSLDDLGRMDFDLALTARPHSRYPINTGVVFVRVSDKTKRWYAQWYEVVQELMRNKSQIMKLHPRYGGINQCALGVMRERDHDLSIRTLRCEEWNLTSDLHHKLNDGTRIVHIQGQLRHRIVNGSLVGGAHIRKLEKIWRSYEQRCKTAST